MYSYMCNRPRHGHCRVARLSIFYFVPSCVRLHIVEYCETLSDPSLGSLNKTNWLLCAQHIQYIERASVGVQCRHSVIKYGQQNVLA